MFLEAKPMDAQTNCKSASSSGGKINPFFPDCKTTFSRIFKIFLCYFLIVKTWTLFAMPNWHLVLHKETLKQHFEK